MKKIVQLFLIALCLGHGFQATAQAIYQYTSATNGAPAYVATGLSATNLAKVGGGTNTPCASGFSGFTVPTTYTSYSTSDPAINVDLTPANGYTMTVTSVSVGIRRSGTGPASCRLAYSIDGGTTWIDKGTDDHPNNAGCGSMSTATWTFPCLGGVTVGNPNYLKFRLFYFNSSNNSGTTQIMNLYINGSVTNGCTPPVATISGSTSFCNSGSTTITFNGTPNATVTYTVNNGPNQNITLNCSGTATLNTGLLVATTTYTLVSASFGNACSQNIAGSATVTITPTPNITVTPVNPTTCNGTDGTLTINGLVTGNTYTVYYTQNAVPQSFNAVAVANAITISGLAAGTYTNIYVVINSCNSNTVAGPITLVDPPAPFISNITYTDPTTCNGTDGTITLYGLLPNTAYTVNYSINNIPQAPLSLTANASGNIIMTNLFAGTYSNITVTRLACSSNVVGPVTLVSPIPPFISNITYTDPTTCNANDGTITLHGLLASTVYNVYYTTGAGPAGPVALTSNAAGELILTNLPAETYSNIYVTWLTCTSNVVGPVTLTAQVPPVITNVMHADPATCSGTGSLTLYGLLPNTAYTVNYYFNAALQTLAAVSDASGNIVINGLLAGSYSDISVLQVNCPSNVMAGPYVLTDPAPPVISGLTFVNPTTCGGADGSITLSGLTPATAYLLNYDKNAAPQGPLNITANASGNIVIANLAAAQYSNITVTLANCISNVVGPVNLVDPVAPFISNIAYTDPANCGGLGTITLSGLLANQSYTLYYDYNAAPQGPYVMTANASGQVIIIGLVPGVYTNIYVLKQACTSNVVGPLTLAEPPAPPPPLTTDITYCQGELAAPLTAVGQNLLWYTAPTGGIGLPSLIPPTTTPGTVTYYVSQQINNCESSRAALMVTVKPKPAAPVTATPAYTYCQFEAGATALTAAGTDILWYSQATGGTGTATAPVPNTNNAGTFTWYATQTLNGCESERLPIVVTIYPKPQPPVVADVKYCEGDNAGPLTAGGQNLQWYTAPLGGTPQLTAPQPATNVLGTVTWYVSQSLNGCESDRAAISYTVYFTPDAAIIASSDTACQYDTLTFTYQGNGTADCDYNWTVPAGAQIVYGAGTPSISVLFNGFGEYLVSLMVDNHGCQSPLVMDTVNVKLAPEVHISSPAAACPGDTVNISANYVIGPVEEYVWDFDGGHVLPVKHQKVEGPYFVKWSTPGIHTVTLIANYNGCDSKPATDSVIVHPDPGAKIMAVSRDNICPGDTVTLSASTNDPLNKYWWYPEQYFDYGNGTAVLQGAIDMTGYVKLQVTSPYGCIATDSVLINARSCCSMVFPSAFTPNGDGKNDKFRPITAGHNQLSYFRIYDRWGKIVYESLNSLSGWDGSLGGVAQDIGTYYYQVKYTCEGEVMEKGGNFILMR